MNGILMGKMLRLEQLFKQKAVEMPCRCVDVILFAELQGNHQAELLDLHNDGFIQLICGNICTKQNITICSLMQQDWKQKDPDPLGRQKR